MVTQSAGLIAFLKAPPRASVTGAPTPLHKGPTVLLLASPWAAV